MCEGDSALLFFAEMEAAGFVGILLPVYETMQHHML
jgi:hypothetical protein